MKQVDPEWYKNHWTLDIEDMSWVEHTEAEVAFVIRELALRRDERVLDIACGFGRHSLELARRGFEVVGVDITEAYVNEARTRAAQEGLSATFIQADVREVSFSDEFDVVLVVAVGAIGYLENDEENLKAFDLFSQALSPGGKHFMAVCNAAHAKSHFPSRGWDAGEKSLSLADFEWDDENRRMIYTGYTYRFGEVLKRPEPDAPGSSIRLYTREDLTDILAQRGMHIVRIYAEYGDTTPASEDSPNLLVYSRKE